MAIRAASRIYVARIVGRLDAWEGMPVSCLVIGLIPVHHPGRRRGPGYSSLDSGLCRKDARAGGMSRHFAYVTLCTGQYPSIEGSGGQRFPRPLGSSLNSADLFGVPGVATIGRGACSYSYSLPRYSGVLRLSHCFLLIHPGPTAILACISIQRPVSGLVARISISGPFQY